MRPTVFADKAEGLALYNALHGRVESTFESHDTVYACFGITLHHSGRCWVLLIGNTSAETMNYPMKN
jgi:hypothetical protein